MVLEFLGNLVVSIASLLGNSFLYAIPVFLAVWLVGRPLHAFFQKRWKRSWIQSAWLASYGMFFVVLIIAFFFPVWEANRDSTTGIPPPEIRLTLTDMAGQFVFGLVRVILAAGLLALLVLPLLFVGALIKDLIQKRLRSRFLCIFFGVWATVLLALTVVLFLVPWVVPGLLYLLYWA